MMLAFKRFMEIEREVQKRFQTFIQSFEDDMHTFFQQYLLPLSGGKLPISSKPISIDPPKPEPQLPVKRPKENFSFPQSSAPKKSQPQPKRGDSELNSYMELLKSRVRELYEKNISPSFISKLFNLNLELVHSLGNWKQVPDEISSKMIEMKNECLKLKEKGFTLKEIGKTIRIPRKKVLILFGELTPIDLLKSAESKKCVVNKIAEGVSKIALSQELGTPVYKIQNWVDKVSNGRPLSDEDSIRSEGEISRETIRNSIFHYYQTNNKDLAASICSQKPEKIVQWVDRFENGTDIETIKFKKSTPQPFPESYENLSNSLISDFFKKSY
ncbi:unnamed protein product [Blepharisma stoltei]|uniref:Uncharacterized protein n=1 Tax=Blepharisma stoltei TaxID=1481888 RepID=A0AAU9JB06_9CILI|nr:unnamed protein product [Blepharisma stoltei]